MGFKRPLVQIQSLGPEISSRIERFWSFFFIFSPNQSALLSMDFIIQNRKSEQKAEKKIHIIETFFRTSFIAADVAFF